MDLECQHKEDRQLEEEAQGTANNMLNIVEPFLEVWTFRHTVMYPK